MFDPRPRAVADTECYINYWSFAVKEIGGTRKKLLEFYEGHPLDRAALANIMRKWCLVGFNFAKYDILMILLAMQPGTTNAQLKAASDEIIQKQLQPWVFMDRYDLTQPDFVDYIDLMEVHPGAPQRPSLKMLGGRLHSRRIQELPIEHDAHITEEDRTVMRGYVFNDLCTTEDLYYEVKPQLDLREQMSEMYGVDLRSKSDPQIAEAVLKHEVEKELGRKVYKPDLKRYSFKYRIPDFIKFETPILKGLLEEIRATDFDVDPSGSDATVADDDDDADSPKAVAKKKSRLVGLPKSLSRDLHIGATVYQMGIGGLHSKEKSRAFVSNDKYVLKDRDVTSYYPSIVINQNLKPGHLGDSFLSSYKAIFNRRVAAKRKAAELSKEIAAVEARIKELERG